MSEADERVQQLEARLELAAAREGELRRLLVEAYEKLVEAEADGPRAARLRARLRTRFPKAAQIYIRSRGR